MLRILLGCLALVLLPGPLRAASWTSVPPSQLGFEGMAQGERFSGEFQRFHAHIAFDPAQPQTARFEVEIDLASADSRNAERDELLRDPAFLDAAGQPRARFVSTGAEPDGEGWVTRGRLTLKGRSHEVPFHFRFAQDSEDEARLEGHARLDRTWFGVGSGEWEDAELIAHEVEVRTRLRLRPAAAGEGAVQP